MRWIVMLINHPISFIHHVIFANPSLTESVCPLCGTFVAASTQPRILMIAEAAHACPWGPAAGLHTLTHRDQPKDKKPADSRIYIAPGMPKGN